MSEFLTEQELLTLTGTRQRAKQIEVLRNNRVHFFERLDGKPVVAKEAIVHAIRGDSVMSADDRDGFNLDAIKH